MRWNSNRSLVSERRRLGRLEGVSRRGTRLAVELLEPRSMMAADCGFSEAGVASESAHLTELEAPLWCMTEYQPIEAWFFDETSLPNDLPVDELSASGAVEPEIVVDPAACYDGEWLLGIFADIDATAMSPAEMLTLADDSGVEGDDGAQVTIETESAAQAAFSGLSATAGAADRPAGTSGTSARLFAAFGFSLPSAGEDLFKPGTGKRRHR